MVDWDWFLIPISVSMLGVAYTGGNITTGQVELGLLILVLAEIELVRRDMND